ncbi:ABC transporter ATP-binding protein [Devosia rhodophyticola]|uniref:ABC transporter ATP-binding protein n=1 Tax=Devosia rhodophyticola TaxID=3026423 RepID=A0ABY7YY57_9HYPH|nr:ABC transporter ATP-binding protein [Devosia rhodophyticola]WDR06318.1 ABC transporter ATP-binding protein [Devosia rhodophyticola]
MVGLQLDEVGAAYGRKTIISGVCVPKIAAGEVVAVIGPNAAGKSTLFKRIAGLVKGPGTVQVTGSDKGRNAIGYMPQDSSANAVLSVYESLLLARKQKSSWSVADADLIYIDRVLGALNITDLSFRDLGALSGGQRQLVSMAQALVREPDILLMDEPTSALDLHRQVEVLDFVTTQARQRGMIVMIALHDLNQALRFADRVVLIDHGVMRAFGTPSEVITASMLRQIYRVEARIEKCSRNFDHVIVDATAA